MNALSNVFLPTVPMPGLTYIPPRQLLSVAVSCWSHPSARQRTAWI
jgi:hypothetical protein